MRTRRVLVKPKPNNEKRGAEFPLPLLYPRVKLLEVTLQQTLQSLAVAGFVASHFVDGEGHRGLERTKIVLFL